MPKADQLLVFLSHASEDKPKVRKLCQRLKADGFDPWLDEQRLLPGQDWKLEIEKAMRNSGAILLCFSSQAAQAKSAQRIEALYQSMLSRAFAGEL
ncbi:MAG TPA: toll/interleukin-1 receptor domain-containing protein [Anaerolineales bacterium]|nr:toll/interleukin-1 receptor domain-containing protein [Anaerolineales bacterium]